MDISCPQCGAEFEITAEDLGRKVLCPCGLKFIAGSGERVVPAVTGSGDSRPRGGGAVSPPSVAYDAGDTPTRCPEPGNSGPAPSPKALKVVTGTEGKPSAPRVLPARKATLPPPAGTGAVPRTTATRIAGTATLTAPIRAAKGGQRVMLAALAVAIVVLAGLLVWLILKG